MLSAARTCRRAQRIMDRMRRGEGRKDSDLMTALKKIRRGHVRSDQEGRQWTEAQRLKNHGTVGVTPRLARAIQLRIDTGSPCGVRFRNQSPFVAVQHGMICALLAPEFVETIQGTASDHSN